MIVAINGYEFETENIVKFYPCDIFGNYQEQSKFTYIEFKDGMNLMVTPDISEEQDRKTKSIHKFKGIYVCNATELSEKIEKGGADNG